MIIVLMGVSGSGKTTIGKLLAKRAAAIFADADDYHPAANKLKMAAGHPLTDEDRLPWLHELNRIMKSWQAAGTKGVLACSALKDQYRKILAAGIPPDRIAFVLLDGSQALIAERLAHRHHEFMNAHLLASQFATLEPPHDGLRVVNDKSPLQTVTRILALVPAFAIAP